MLKWFRRPPVFFTQEEQELLLNAIKLAEEATSGELRLFVESKCTYVDAIDRARELFFDLGMYKTSERNGVLVYVATKDRQLAIFADEGVYQKLGRFYWQENVQHMLSLARQNNLTQGLSDVIIAIGEALKTEFPYNKRDDRNELSDEIIFGK